MTEPAPPRTLNGTFRAAVPELTPVPANLRTAFLDLPPDLAAHGDACAAVPALRQVEVGGARAAAAPAQLRVAAWNLERCLYPDAAAALLRRHGVALALLTEMDAGMHRTGQRHATRAVAAALGQRYGYALEFLELATMPAPIAFPGNPPDNQLGFHGNGFTAALPFSAPVVIRLDPIADWFARPRGSQKRVGNRMAVAATFTHASWRFVGCAVHLESDSDFSGRALQMRGLLDALDAYAGDLPVVIGGDLNTEVAAGGHEDPDETLFALARSRGYDWASCNVAAATTRPSLWSAGAGARQLDWFCTRGLRASAPAVVPALDDAGAPLSDHELIMVTLAPAQ
jgi:endonuclease/exonuclease/phosphatase family metal-dependent hydrolase